MEFPDEQTSSRFIDPRIQSMRYRGHTHCPQDGLLAEEQAAIRHTGDAESCLYVTYKTPVTAAGPLYHTVVHTGCVAAKPVTGDDAVVFDAIWGKFETRAINKINIEGGAIVEGEVLSYYGKHVENAENEPKVMATLEIRVEAPGPGLRYDQRFPGEQIPSRAREFATGFISSTFLTTKVEGLLIKFDGTCGAWKEFAQGVFGAQGIAVSRLGIERTDEGSGSHFRVNCNVAGQGAPDPYEKIWSNHVVIEYDGQVYDPSYGTSYGAKTSALDAFAQNVADIGIVYDVDAGLVSQSWSSDIGTVDVLKNGVLSPHTTLVGYGYLYEATDSSPQGSDFRWT